MTKFEKRRDGLYTLPGGNGAALSIGDPSGAKVTPRLRSEKWAGSKWGSCWLELACRDVEPGVAAEKLKAIKGKDAIEIEAVRTDKKGKRTDEVHRLLSETNEWDIYWPAVKDMPRDEVFHGGVRYYRIEFSVASSPGTVWEPQPFLTQQQIDAGYYRPDNVNNSYAIYGPISGDYLRADRTPIELRQTGKLAHYYRSKFVAANGDWTWCLDLLDATASIMAVLIPADFVDAANQNAAGELDPNFGYETGGASTGGAYDLGIIVLTSPRTAAAGDSIVSASVYSAYASGVSLCQLGVYDDSTNRLSQGTQTIGASLAWYTATLSGSMSAGVKYYPAYIVNHAGWRYDSGTTNCRNYRSGNTLPDTWTSGTVDSVARHSLYATYAVAAVGNPARWFFNNIILKRRYA